jgi:hypothetical protein
MAEKQRMFIDAGHLEELRAKAHQQSRTESELLEEIIRSYLVLAPRRANSLGDFLRTSSVVVARKASSRSPRKRR